MDATQKMNLILERNEEFDRYIEAITRLEAWRSGKTNDLQNFSSQSPGARRREIIKLLETHLAGISSRLVELDNQITGINGKQ